MNHDKSYYMALPYQTLWDARCEEGERYYVVSLREIDGVCGDGLTREEAVLHLWESFDSYLDWRLGDGLEVPQPSTRRTAQKVRAVVQCELDLNLLAFSDATNEEIALGEASPVWWTSGARESDRLACVV